MTFWSKLKNGSRNSPLKAPLLKPTLITYNISPRNRVGPQGTAASTAELHSTLDSFVVLPTALYVIKAGPYMLGPTTKLTSRQVAATGRLQNLRLRQVASTLPNLGGKGGGALPPPPCLTRRILAHSSDPLSTLLPAHAKGFVETQLGGPNVQMTHLSGLVSGGTCLRPMLPRL